MHYNMQKYLNTWEIDIQKMVKTQTELPAMKVQANLAVKDGAN